MKVPVSKGRHVTPVSQTPVLHGFRTIVLVALVNLSLHITTFAAPSPGFVHGLVRYLETLVILEERHVPEMSAAFFARDHSIVLGAWWEGRVGIAQHFAFVLPTSLATPVTRLANLSLRHVRRKVLDDVIIDIVKQ